MVTVPNFGFGIRPFGPRTRATRPANPIMSGVAMQRSKSILPAKIESIRFSAPTTSAPAAFASSAFRPEPKRQRGRFYRFRSAASKRREPSGRHISGSIPRLIAKSTVSSNLAFAFSLTSLTASFKEYSLDFSMVLYAFSILFSCHCPTPQPLHPSKQPDLLPYSWRLQLLRSSNPAFWASAISFT